MASRRRPIQATSRIFRFRMAGTGQKNGAILKTLWIEDDSGCWLWIGCIHKVTGYAKKQWHGRTLLAHRWMYEQRIGPIPAGLVIDHVCNVRNCVNPEHLQAITQAQNVQRCYDQGRHPRRKSQ